MLRNKEIARFLTCYVILTAVAGGLSFIISVKAGIILLVFAAISGSIFYALTAFRYRRVAELSEEIDRVLHKEEYLFVNREAEGELSILGNEIEKMTIRIREQNETLKQEKIYLADSLADIAHQLRTPLTSANLIISLLEQNTDPLERRKLLKEMEQLFVQMEWLINSLLKISRLDAGILQFRREPVKVSELVMCALKPFLITMELHQIEVNVEIDADIQVTGDLEWLTEALQNILKNCIQSIGDGGTIALICQQNSLYTELLIHDSGAGFSKEDLPHVFERFYRGSGDSASGYGIGLALSKMICIQSDATLTAKNHPEGGALFCIHFPKE